MNIRKILLAIITLFLLTYCDKYEEKEVSPESKDSTEQSDDEASGDKNEDGKGEDDDDEDDEGDSVEKFKSLLSEEEYNAIFPKRYGRDVHTGAAVSGMEDFYTYQSLLDAIGEMSNISIEVYQRDNGDGTYVTYAEKIVWKNKSTGKEQTFITNDDYNASWNLTKKEHKVVDLKYSDFCSKGSSTDEKRELAAFLANISHETTGLGSNDSHKDTGLYYREEVHYANNPSAIGYISDNTMYPPVAGKSYHGRGPIQLSWNYNYGPASQYIFGDKNVLLSTPEKVLESGKIAFMTAIWFWMTPQSPKPSCHQVMVGDWVANSQDIAAGRDKSKFGMTVNIINGGLECGASNWDYRGIDRVGFYERYLDILGIDKDGDICTCAGMQAY